MLWAEITLLSWGDLIASIHCHICGDFLQEVRFALAFRRFLVNENTETKSCPFKIDVKHRGPSHWLDISSRYFRSNKPSRFWKKAASSIWRPRAIPHVIAPECRSSYGREVHYSPTYLFKIVRRSEGIENSYSCPCQQSQTLAGFSGRHTNLKMQPSTKGCFIFFRI